MVDELLKMEEILIEKIEWVDDEVHTIIVRIKMRATSLMKAQKKAKKCAKKLEKILSKL